MNDIHPLSSSNPMAHIKANPPAPHAASNGVHHAPADSVEVSQDASRVTDLLAKLEQLPDVRESKISHAREQIASGTADADADARIDAILDDLLDDINDFG